MALETIVRRDRLVVGAIYDLRVNGVSVGATQGIVTFRQAKTFYDVDDLAQISGTVLKSLTDDKRFVDATLAEGSLENIQRAWDDDVGVLQEQSFTQFNANETMPRGLGTNGNRIFMLGDDNGAVYRLDDIGRAIRLKGANVAAFPTDFNISGYDDTYSLAYANGKMYAILGNGTDYILATLDLKTGIGTRVLISGATDTVFTGDETTPAGMAYDGTNMFVVGAGNNLNTVVLTSAVVTEVSGAVADYGVAGLVLNDLAWTGNELVGVGVVGGVGHVYVIDRTTGRATVIGETSANNFGVDETSPQGVVWYDNSLWMVGGTTQKFYRLDIQTGLATAVGDVSTYFLNNPVNEDLEKTLQIVAPGTYGRVRLYDYPIVVSMATGEHSPDKAGKIMVPVSWEVLNDPQGTAPGLDGVERKAEFGTVYDVPLGHSILEDRNIG